MGKEVLRKFKQFLKNQVTPAPEGYASSTEARVWAEQDSVNRQALALRGTDVSNVTHDKIC